MVAAGLAGSRPLTWHVVLRLVGTAGDHVHDLRGAAAGRAVGLLRGVRRRRGLAGEVAALLVPPPLILLLLLRQRVAALAHQS